MAERSIVATRVGVPRSARPGRTSCDRCGIDLIVNNKKVGIHACRECRRDRWWLDKMKAAV